MPKLAFLLLLIFSNVSAQTFSFSEWEVVVPSENIPNDITIQNSNNNLDAIDFNGKYYLAFRTAPSHFASSKTLLHILESTDLENWQLSHTITHNNDLREPRFYILNNTLHFIYFEGGSKMLKFEPINVWTTQLTNNKWEESLAIENLEHFVPWRVRVYNDTAYLSAYYGLNLYSENHESDMRLFYSVDGLVWEKISKQAQISRNDGGEEGEFIFDKQGNIFGITRLEKAGGLLFSANSNSKHTWSKKFTKKKYDSSLLFYHNDELYLLARRNLDKNGVFDQAPKILAKPLRNKYNLARYSLTEKTTALFKYDTDKMEITHLTDLPSTGDNSFPAIIKLNENQYVVFNYSNDFTKKRFRWIGGQLAKTNIYKSILTFK